MYHHHYVPYFQKFTDAQFQTIGNTPTNGSVYEPYEEPRTLQVIEEEDELIHAVSKLDHSKVYSKRSSSDQMIYYHRPIMYSYEYLMITRIKTPEEIEQNRLNMIQLMKNIKIHYAQNGNLLDFMN
jgi:hypothetical protein